MSQEDRTKSIEKTLEILQDIFGKNNQDLIDSCLAYIRESEEREEQGKSNESSTSSINIISSGKCTGDRRSTECY
jgi:hypothetical protein